MSKDEKEICLYCKAWKLLQLWENSNSGECRRKSPAAQSGWYTTREDDWCLEFVERRDDHESTFEHISEPANRVLGKLTGGKDAA